MVDVTSVKPRNVQYVLPFQDEQIYAGTTFANHWILLSNCCSWNMCFANCVRLMVVKSAYGTSYSRHCGQILNQFHYIGHQSTKPWPQSAHRREYCGCIRQCWRWSRNVHSSPISDIGFVLFVTRKILRKDLGLKSYKIQLRQELKPGDYNHRVVLSVNAL